VIIFSLLISLVLSFFPILINPEQT